jgi:branched-chain amino acid transport system substrate-binding protein
MPLKKAKNQDSFQPGGVLLSLSIGKALLRRTTSLVFLALFVFSTSITVLLGPIRPVASQALPNTIEIAAILSLTGEGALSGKPVLEGIQLAIADANANGSRPQVQLTLYDDQSDLGKAKELAQDIVNSDALLTLGPSFSTTSVEIGAIFAEAGLVSLPPTATSDAITDNATTFRMVFKNSDQGALLATYIDHVLGAKPVTVIVEDDTYGQTLRAGFEPTANQLDLDVTYYTFQTMEQIAPLTRRLVAEGKAEGPIVLLTLDPAGAELLTRLKRQSVPGPFLGGDALGDEGFAQFLADVSGSRIGVEVLTENLYSLSPVILDSANADILAFAERFQAHYGHAPDWLSVAGYDAATLAAQAVRQGVARHSTTDIARLRSVVFSYLYTLNRVDKALPGLLGPFWFDASRARPQGIRVGRFEAGQLASAPLQIVPVPTPDSAELASGEVFPLGDNQFARLQRVVYTGVFLNEISRVDIANASFNADFYLWLRFAKEAGTDSIDPTDLIFPTAIDSSFDSTQPSKKRLLDDGTEYWLWRVRGEFRNDYDLHLYPFDKQSLLLPFFNARADLHRIVYVLDEDQTQETLLRQASAVEPSRQPPASRLNNPITGNDFSPAEPFEITSPRAFRNLTQWQALSTQSRRKDLVTPSALGDPTLAAVQSQRELSGFLVRVDIQRRTLATLMKSLLPLLLMTFIMYASLHFPVALVKEKVSVAITGALSGAVLLTAINNQLGRVGYIFAVEYVFYIFFCLSLLCIIGVLTSERLRSKQRKEVATLVDRWVKIIYLTTVALTFIGTLIFYINR